MRTVLPLLYTVVAVVMIFCLSCGPPPPAQTVKRLDPNATTDLSGKWNDGDANEVAKVMIRACLQHPWATNYRADKGKLPVVRLAPLRNRTDEHINTKLFTEHLEQEIINSGMATVVADEEGAEAIRDERADQAQHASDATAKSQGKETGSDFVLNGLITSAVDAAGIRKIKTFQVTLELTNSESNHKVWKKVHRIKKEIQKTDF